MLKDIEFQSFGHQKFCGIFIRPTDLAFLLDCPDSRISEYRARGVVPEKVRRRLRGLGIDLSNWDERPDPAWRATRDPRELPVAMWEEKPRQTAPVSASVDLPAVEALGIEGLQQVIQRGLREAAGLPTDHDLWTKIAGWQTTYAKLQQEAPIAAEAEKSLNLDGVPRWRCFWLAAAERFRSWVLDHPGRRPLEPEGELCLAVVERGSVTGERGGACTATVLLLSLTALDDVAAMALAETGGWEPPREGWSKEPRLQELPERSKR